MRLLKSKAYTPLLVIIALFLSATSNAQAASWKVSTKDGESIAITPKHNLMVKMIKPRNGIWGKLYVNLNDTQIENLKKHRLDKYFSFISVGIEIDGYTRDANAKVVEKNRYVRIDLDQRTWELLKKGNTMKVHLPEGTTYAERLRGSSKALRNLERKVFSQY